MPTWRVILPVKDEAGNIVDWIRVAMSVAPTMTEALTNARKGWGQQADVQEYSLTYEPVGKQTTTGAYYDRVYGQESGRTRF
jgi:hypothetical protein